MDREVTRTEAAVLLDWLPAMVERMNDTEDERSAWFRSPEGYHSMLLCSVPPVLGSGGTAWVESGPDAAPYPPYKKGAVE